VVEGLPKKLKKLTNIFYESYILGKSHRLQYYKETIHELIAKSSVYFHCNAYDLMGVFKSFQEASTLLFLKVMIIVGYIAISTLSRRNQK
jgi:hypothetical protein